MLYLILIYHIILVFTYWRLLECSWAPLSFALHIVAKVLWFCLCSFDAMIELHPMDEELVNDFLIGKWKWFSYVI